MCSSVLLQYSYRTESQWNFKTARSKTFDVSAVEFKNTEATQIIVGQMEQKSIYTP